MNGPWPYPGARWWKFDFHAHTPASFDTTAGGVAKGTVNEVTPETWLLRYMAAGLDCIAITDHNSGAWVDELKLEYDRMKLAGQPEFRELHIFPGVEISVNGGFHLLAVFDKTTTTSDIDALLGKVGYEGTRGDGDGVTRKSPVEVIEVVIEAGGLPIPAHVDAKKGLLKVDGSAGGKSSLDPNTLRQVFGCGRILAMEVVSNNWNRPQVYVDAGCGWSEVLGSDCHNFQQGPQPGDSFTWIKMAEPALEGVRLALLDGARFSIRRSDDPQPFDPFLLPNHLIESVTISNARYMGRGSSQEFRLSPWFNALVGGRGTGKSTVVHALRLAYNRDGELKVLPEGNDARRTFERFVMAPGGRNDENGALDYQSSRTTKISVALVREGVRYSLCWRQDLAGTSVEEDVNGGWQPSASQSVTAERFPVRIFSQGQIAALAGESHEALLAVIDEAAKTEAARRALEDARQRYFSLCAQLRELGGRLADRNDVEVRLVDITRKLAGFEGKQHAEVLKVYQIRSRQEHETDRQVADVRGFADRLRVLAEQLVPPKPPTGLFDDTAAADREALAGIERLHGAVTETTHTLLEGVKLLEGTADDVRAALDRGAWQAALTQAKTHYSSLIDGLKAQGVVDPGEYGSLVQERQRAERELAQLDLLGQEHTKISEELAQQGRMVREARQALTKGRAKFLVNTLAQNPYVRIELVPYGRDPRGAERALRDVLGVTDDRFGDDILAGGDEGPPKGLVAELLSNLPDNTSSAASTVEKRLDALAGRFLQARTGHGDFGGRFNNYLHRECTKRPELLDRLLVWHPEDGLKVEYSPRGDGQDFRSIGQASAGQRAAAILAFLLAYGDEPLVLDQPEDDLDNHLIYDLVVRQIRANKMRRQILVVTHNANIVVNGDAEMLHGLDFRGGQCRVVQKGCLQDSAMREEVCRVMEGGREAFERRYKRLGRDT